MNTRSTIVKNIAALSGAQFVTSLFTPFLYILIARSLGEEVFGKYSFIMSMIIIFLVLSDLGIKSVAIRDVARNPDRIETFLRSIIALKFVLALLSSLVFIGAVTVLDMPADTTKAAYIFSAGLFFQSMSFGFRWVFQALQIMEWEAAVRIADRFLLLVLSAAVIWRGFGILALSAAFVATEAVVCLLSAYFVLRRVRITRLEADFGFLKYLLRTAVFFALCEIFWMIYFKIDMVMLARIRGEAEVGLYNAAYVVINAVTLISMLLMQTVFPVLSHLFQKEQKKLRQATERLLRYLLIIAFLCVALVVVLSEPIIHLLYGNDYARSALALRILVLVVPFLFAGNLFAHVLASSNRHKKLTVINGFGVLANVVLNGLLIPRYGFQGAAAATIATNVMLLIFLYLAVSGFLHLRSGALLIRLLPGISIVTAAVLLRNQAPPLLLVTAVLALYTGSLFLSRSLTRHDLTFLIDAVGKKSRPPLETWP